MEPEQRRGPGVNMLLEEIRNREAPGEVSYCKMR